MAKHQRKPPSRAERRAAVAKQKAERQRLLIIIGGVVAVLVVALIVWQVWPDPAAEPGAETVALDGERPLAAIPPAERNNYFNGPPAMSIDTSR